MTATSFSIGLGLNALAHRFGSANPGAVLQAAVLAAEAAGFDFVTLDDAFGDSELTGRVPIDAVLFASALAPLTHAIGLIPATNVNLREPFHLSTAIATLDHVSRGRAGWLPVIAAPEFATTLAQHTGSTVYGLDYASPEALLADAADVIDVARRLWDSWEDDAIVRDAATGRFVDREKLHYVNFEGASFSVRGPSIVPRPPQGQAVVAVRADDATLALAAAHADLAFFDAESANDARGWLERLRAASRDSHRATPRGFVDVVVAFGTNLALPRTLPATLFRGTPAELAAWLPTLAQLGVAGARLHPLDPVNDLAVLAQDVLPTLHDMRFEPPRGQSATLRERLGLAVATNRYAQADTSAESNAR